MNVPILILRLEGALQRFGERARWDFRDTNMIPTKSAVIGILACAMGYGRGDERILNLQENLTMGIRVDKAGLLMQDFHTVTSNKGYLVAATGGKRVGSATIVTPRQYIQDACFTVALSGDEDLIRKCEKSLKDPVWPIYLGAKCCVPSRPVFEAITYEYSDVLEAIRNYKLCERCDKNTNFYGEYEDGNYRDGKDIVHQDVFLNGPNRYYGFRRVHFADIKRELVG